MGKLLCSVGKLVAALLLGAFVASDAAAVTINLNWDTPADKTNIDGYKVYYGTSASGPFSTLGATVNGANTSSATVNIATNGVYYFTVRAFKNSPALESVNSNTVRSTLFTLPVALENVTNASLLNGRTFTVSIVPVGASGGQYPIKVTAANSAGVISGYSLASSASPNLVPANVDIWLKTSGFLGKRVSNYAITSGAALPALLAGDTTTNTADASYNRVNLFDATAINADWGTNNIRSDFNLSGSVNLLDAAAINRNWGLVGDPQPAP